MNARWTIIFLDYFGLKHKWASCANNKKEALANFYKKYSYPVKEIVDIYIDWKEMDEWKYLEMFANAVYEID